MVVPSDLIVSTFREVITIAIIKMVWLFTPIVPWMCLIVCFRKGVTFSSHAIQFMTPGDAAYKCLMNLRQHVGY